MPTALGQQQTRSMWEPIGSRPKTALEGVSLKEATLPSVEQLRAAASKLTSPGGFDGSPVSEELLRLVVR